MARVTFSLSDETIAEIRRTAARLRKPQSHVVREAVAAYAESSERLSEAERRHTLAVLERLRTGPPPARSGRAVDRELAALRAARRRGGRRTQP